MTHEPATLMFLAGCGAVLGGMVMTQVGVNRSLGGFLGSVPLAGLASFLIGTVGLIVYCLVSRPPLPSREQLAGVPLWAWTGGLLGAIYIVCSIILASRLGSATLIASVIAGQLLTSLLLDHFGLVGFSVQPITLGRVGGAALLLTGAALILRF